MSYDARIILGAQQFDLASAMNAGRDMAMQQKQMDQQNALADLYKTQGAGIMAGDQNALAQLAQFDPGAALGIQQTRQQMAYSAEDQQRQREESRARAEAALAEQAATLTAEQLAAEEKALTEVLSGAAFFYQNQDQAGYEAFLRSKGADPAEYPFQAFPAHAAAVEGVLDAFKTFAPPSAPEPTDDMREFQYAQENPAFAEYQTQQKKAGATNVSTTVGLPGEEPPAGDALRASITDADTMLSMIEAIDTNKALPKVTGALEGGGGNNVDDMNAIQRAWYGDDGLALIQSIGQLQGNAWLGARALLKGGGQITDYESKKAEGAMARLSRAQGTKEFKAALSELKEALKDGLEKLRAAQTPAAGATGGTAKEMSDEDFLKSLGIE